MTRYSQRYEAPRSGVERRAAADGDVGGVNARQQQVEIIELGGRRDAEQGVEVIGADAAVGTEVEVEGREAGGGLGDVERLCRMPKLFLELLALGDVGDGADEVRG